MPPLALRPAANEAAGPTIRVGLIGAGFAARMIIRHLLTPVPGIRLAAVANRTLAHAVTALPFPDVPVAGDLATLEENVAAEVLCLAADPHLLCAAANLDVLIEATGTIDFAAELVLDALRHRRHVVLVNAELDATLGPVLRHHADRAGVVLTNTDGDEPGVAMTLLRYLRSVGLRPVAAGNLKGMIDRYRTPDTQRDFAQRHGIDACKAASFADGTKLALESTILANATGFHVACRGMLGPRCDHVREMTGRLPLPEMLTHGLVDYALGAEPHSGVFVLTHEADPRRRQELAYFKLGEGPLYAFYAPFHLPHIQVAASIKAAAWEHRATIAPLGGPVCAVAALAKRDLGPDEVLDGIGGFNTYGVIENAATFSAERLLPIGLSSGCRLRRRLRRDQPVTYDDVELPPERPGDRLFREQCDRFPATVAPASLLSTR